jgi:putative FmdB family regulatory protein
MPTYEYECEKCGHHFDVFQSMTEPHRKRCPKCKGKVRRLVSGGAGIVFKGSGFYATDYRSSSYKEQKRKESGESSHSKDSGGTKDSGPKKERDQSPKKDRDSGS